MTRLVLSAFLGLFLVLAASVSLGAPPALAVEPDERLADPALEARARHLSGELRCLVCQNTSIDESTASLAKDLRLLLRERLSAGDSDQQVLDFMVSRYGRFVLLNPRVEPVTYVLWFTGPGLLILGGFIIAFRAGRRVASPELPLSPEERAKLSELLPAKPDSGVSRTASR